MKRWWPFRGQPPVLADDLFALTVARLPILRHLDTSDVARLRALAERFLRTKTFEGAQGLVVTDRMRAEIAVQACLLVLHLDLDLYSDWYTVILYPGDFRVDRETVDEDGVVHQWSEALSGESWEQGPVILSWDAAVNAAGAMNVVLHEFAHKLDMRDGTANGCPPLRTGMSSLEWSRALTAAYEKFQRALETEEMLWLDEYAAENPGEFFAVLSEMFFLQPENVLQDLPGAYQQLRLYYGQDPAVIRGSRERGSA